MSQYKKMNPKLKRKWVEALESGKYRQTTGQLCRTEHKHRAYCCLGVLCEVAGVPRQRVNGLNQYDGNDANLSVNLKRKFGITDTVHSKLIDMNDGNADGVRSSFKEIAAWINKNI